MIAEASASHGAARHGRSGQRADARCSRPPARSPPPAASRYELRLHRARGYGALKAILDVLAEEEPLTLTEIALRLRRTPGSTKDYLSWLEDVDLIVSRQKRYSFADPMMRLWVRLHCRADAADRGRHRARSARLRADAAAAARAGARAGRRPAGRRRARQALGDYRDRLDLSSELSSRFAESRGLRVLAISTRSAHSASCRAPAWPRPAPLPSCSSLPPAPPARRSPAPRRRTAAGAPGRSPPPDGTPAARGRATAAIPAAPTCSPR